MAPKIIQTVIHSLFIRSKKIKLSWTLPFGGIRMRSLKKYILLLLSCSATAEARQQQQVKRTARAVVMYCSLSVCVCACVCVCVCFMSETARYFCRHRTSPTVPRSCCSNVSVVPGLQYIHCCNALWFFFLFFPPFLPEKNYAKTQFLPQGSGVNWWLCFSGKDRQTQTDMKRPQPTDIGSDWVVCVFAKAKTRKFKFFWRLNKINSAQPVLVNHIWFHKLNNLTINCNYTQMINQDIKS